MKDERRAGAGVRVRVVVQARMLSTRLPGKILACLEGRPLLAHVVGRLRQACEALPLAAEVWVATSTATADDATEELCRALGVVCFRGSEDDVLTRYVDATADLSADDLVVRATADNPLYCPVRTARIVAHHLESMADYTCIQELSYAVPEAIRAGALRSMASRAAGADCREHVTPWFRQHPGDFRVVQLPHDWQGLRADVRLTVDTLEDFQRMVWLFRRLGDDAQQASLEQVYRLCDGYRERSVLV